MELVEGETLPRAIEAWADSNRTKRYRSRSKSPRRWKRRMRKVSGNSLFASGDDHVRCEEDDFRHGNIKNPESIVSGTDLTVSRPKSIILGSEVNRFEDKDVYFRAALDYL